jgi:hypothetical protein
VERGRGREGDSVVEKEGARGRGGDSDSMRKTVQGKQRGRGRGRQRKGEVVRGRLQGPRPEA